MSEAMNLLQALVGKPVWGVRRSHGSSFFIEIGAPHLSIREPSPNVETRRQLPAMAKRRITPIGEYSIIVLSCFWTLSKDENTVNYCSDVQIIDEALLFIDGTYLSKVAESDRIDPSTTLGFDNGAFLTLTVNSDVDPDDGWNIRVPDGKVLAIRSDGTLTA